MQSLIINQKEVHLWSTSLVLSSTQESQLLALLSPDEVAKANRFYFPIHRHRYIVARGVLRCLLSRYLQHPPEQIVFSYLQHGKPYTTNIDLQFNISHSHDIAVYALTLNTPIGVDIEKIDATYSDAVAHRFFSKLEYAALNSLPESERLAGFYTIWSRKEALIKAIGEGLAISLASFSVSLQNPIETLALRSANWHIHNFKIDPEYQSAFATTQTVEKIVYRQWDF